MSTDRRSLLEESLAAIQRLQARVDAAESARHEPIAIVGAACRYPGGAETLAQYWELVRNGVDAVADVPADRWNADAFYDPDPKTPGKMITRRGGFLRQVDRFDPALFGISPREAQSLDPQQRLLLETTLEALESAGIAPDTLVGSSTGVFVGITTNDYGPLVRAGGVTNTDVYSATGNALNAAAGRIAFTFGFQGPAVAVDTACSSSLVAVHLAVRALRNGEADLALAGGVNVVLSPDAMIMFSKWGMLAPDGRCKTFDAAADGFVRAEGCATIALKRLSTAIANGDPILAVIRGSAVNQDGRSSGLTVPNGPAQEAVLRRALADARLNPADIDYVEAHGTGTPLGDPIELEALGVVVGAGREAANPLLVGSVKTNLGHTEAASGLAGLLKVVLSLQHEAIPPHLHFTTPNPGIPWSRFPLKVPTSLTPWPRGAHVRRAGVSSFGFSGTNAHIILEEAPAVALPMSSAANDMTTLVPLSARDENALREMAERLGDFIAGSPAVALGDIALTAATGRSHLTHRLALLADNASGLERDVRAFIAGDVVPGLSHGSIRPGERPKVAFLFTGQGAQYAGMGRQLYETEPVYRASLDRSAAILDPLLGRSILDVMFGAAESTALLSETAFTQPALFALEYALAELWASWGIVPAAVLGHSVGEYVAACVAGAMPPEDGLELIATRGRLMQALPTGGAMAAIFAAATVVAEKIAPYRGRVSIAALNGPEETVISGDGDAVAELVAAFESAGVKSRSLDVSHAFHSHRLDPMLDALEREASAIAFAPPRLTLISNLTGAAFAPNAAPDATYWRRHAREPVRFADGLQALRAAGITALVEVGPHPTLLALASRSMPDARWINVASLRRQRDDRREMLGGLGALYTLGASVQWTAVAPRDARRVALPTYPFQRERYWVAPTKHYAAALPPDMHPLLGMRQRSPQAGTQFLAEVGRTAPAFLADHVVLGNTLFPGTGYVEVGLAAARAITGTEAVSVQSIVIEAPLALEEDGRHLLHTTVEPPEADGSAPFVIRSTAADADGEWRVHAKGTLRPGAALASRASATPDDARTRCTTAVDVDEYYEMLERSGLHYGPAFRGVRELSIGPGEAVGVLEAPDDGGAWMLHPAVLDAAFHLVGGALLAGTATDAPQSIFLPIGIDEVLLERSAPRRLVATARVRAAVGEGSHVADLRLEDEAGNVVATVTGLQLRAVTIDTLARALSTHGIATHSYRLRWTQLSMATAPTAMRGRVLVIGDDSQLAAAVSGAFGASGLATDVVCSSDLAAALGDPSAGGVSWVVDATATAASPADLSKTTRAGYAHLLGVAQAVSTAAHNVGLCVLTRGAHAVVGGDDVDPSSTALLGLSRTIGVERAETPTMRIDLDGAMPVDTQLPIVAAALAGFASTEPELAIRGGVLFGARLDDASREEVRPAAQRDVLRIRERGSLDALVLERDARRAPGPNEVEVEIHAAGLNFRDVLNALDMYPGDAGPLGSECAGIVTGVGTNVPGIAVGDEVIAFGIESIASHATISAALVVPKPATISFADAVTIPNPFLTAADSFAAAGGIRPGQRVLVHAAAGGVGLAALRLARRAGAEVIATAGTPDKRAFVIAQGAAHAFDSRSSSFADDVLRVTNGEGVDVVLNSLSGDLIDAGMRVVRPGGAFLEIGKNNIWTPERARELRPQVNYRIIDLGVSMQQDVNRVRAMFVDVIDAIAKGEMNPLPVHAFALTDARAAFRYMAAARHTGKVVLVPSHPAAFVVRPNATYLVTGAFGGLGFAAAEWLVERGAKSVVLTGRNAPTDAQRERIEAMRRRDADVIAVQADVADRDMVRALFRDVLASRPQLRGIIHSAGTLADAALAEQDVGKFDAVARAKVDGTSNLHDATLHHALDFFVLFSSMSAMFGSPGQANYAAANAFLDGFAARRRAHGQTATSIGWGAWAEVGMAARLSDTHRARWSQLGIGQIAPKDAFLALERALAGDAAYVAITAMDARRVASSSGPAVRALLGAPAVASTPRTHAAKEVSLRERLLTTAPSGRRDVLMQHVRALTARVLGVQDANTLRDNEPLREMGLDSLMAIELRNRVQASVQVSVSVAELLGGPTIEEFTDLVIRSLDPDLSPADDSDSRAVDVDLLSDADVDAALAALLNDGRP